MPRTGGESDKLGNRYEGLWTLAQLLDLANGRSEGITIEPLGDHARGVEFIVRHATGVREFHSVKRQRSGGDWSLAALAKADANTGRSVLLDLLEKVASNVLHSACFISATGANDAQEIAHRLTGRRDASEFRQHIATSDRLCRNFEKYVLSLPILSNDWDLAFDLLKRLRIVVIDEGTLRNQVDQRIADLIYRPDSREFSAADVRGLLLEFVLEHLGTEILPGSVWSFLSSSGYHRRDWISTGGIPQIIQQHNAQYLRIIASELINGMVIDYATDLKSPDSDEWLHRERSQSRDFAEDAHVYGYNSVRGTAANAIKHLLFDDYSRSDLLLPVLAHMVHDPSLAVRTCVSDALLPVLNHDSDHAVNLFLELCKGADSIFGAPPLRNFVWYASGHHYSALRDVLQDALNSATPSSVAAAAQQTCLAAFSADIAQPDAARVRSGTEQMRLAAASVYAHNVAESAVRAECESHLKAFFNDESEEVRARAADCFHQIAPSDLANYVDLIRFYVESRAYPSPHDDLLRQLERSSVQLPDVVLRLTERFIEVSGRDASNISTAAAGDASSVSKLIVRLYTQSTDEAVRTRCLDLIDEMERLAFYGIDEQLKEHDR